MSLHFSHVETHLRDGTEVVVRWIRPDDADRLRTMIARLSEESRLGRFMTPLRELSSDQIRFLTDVDFDRHIAWIAFPANDPDSAIGVGRCVRAEDDPGVGEAAVTVLDAYENRGLATLLLALLSISAQAVGIERFRAYVLESNTPCRELLHDIGVSTHFDSPGLVRVDVPVTLVTIADSPGGRALKESAKNFSELAARRSPERAQRAG